MRNLIPRAAALAGAGTLLAGLAVALTAPPASASTEVTCPHDNLQAAINAAAPGATIEVSGTCTGTFTITKDLTIQGQPATTLDGGGTGIVVTVDQGATAVLHSLTIQHGDGFIGGGIFNGGAVTLEDSTVSGNTASGDGGGIYNNVGTVTLEDSTVSGNTASEEGGGINNNGGTVTLEDSTVSGNTAFLGGGIANGGAVTLKDSTVSGNTANDEGGGINNNSGTVTLEDSTVSGNTAHFGVGGGISNNLGATATLTDSTVSGNKPDNCFPPGSVPGCTG